MSATYYLYGLDEKWTGQRLTFVQNTQKVWDNKGEGWVKRTQGRVEAGVATMRSNKLKI